jgi:sodium/potassium/calcium exchanger 6
LTQQDKCSVATTYCHTSGLIDFFKLYYCTLAGNLYLYLPISVSHKNSYNRVKQVLILSLAFFYLSFVADEHLSPSLQRISKTFKLSESLAGVTLLAFGAGAPDVFASLSASEDAEGI